MADDAITCLSELTANAVLHSNSRLSGGSFTVQAGRDVGGRLRLEVIDQGGPWDPSPDPDGQHGRGLLIVARLAADWGIAGHLDGRTVARTGLAVTRAEGGDAHGPTVNGLAPEPAGWLSEQPPGWQAWVSQTGPVT